MKPMESSLNIQSILSSSTSSEPMSLKDQIASSHGNTNVSGGLPVGAWVGIGFAVAFILVLGAVLFFGHKKVTDYLVAAMTRKNRNSSQPARPDRGSISLHPLPPRSSSVYLSKMSQTGATSTPRTTATDIPFASIEIEPDGRLSPRLPIPSKRGSSLPGTPYNIHRR